MENKRALQSLKRNSVWPVEAWKRDLGTPSISYNSIVRAGFLAKKKKTKKTFAYKCMKDYCHNCSVHGLKYVADEDNYKLERTFWLICVLCAIIGAVFFLYPFFTKYYQAQMFTTVESTSEPIWNIPFPAVTICNVNKASLSLIKEQAQKSPWSNYSEDVIKEIVDLMTQMGQIPVDKIHQVDEIAKKAFNTQEDYTDSLMKNVIQPIERMAVRCWWKGYEVKCSEIFELRRTDEGYCWAFNSKPMETIQPGETIQQDGEDFYDDDEETGENDATQTQGSGRKDAAGTVLSPRKLLSERSSVPIAINFVPKVVYGSGPNMGLTVLLNPDFHEYFANTNNLLGFKIHIHHPNDFASVASKGLLVNAKTEVFAAISATSTVSTNNVRDIPITRRNCLFIKEKSLDFYNLYTYANCLLQCQVRAMKKKCKCAPYIYSQLKNIKICDYDGMRCINNNTRKFFSIQPKSEVLKTGIKVEAMRKCKCPSNCNHIVYNPEVTAARFPLFPNDVNIPANITQLNKTDLALLRVFFKDLTFVQFRKDVLYTWNDLIAAFGGIAGLFIGFSFISGAELIYFFILRPILRWSNYFKS